MDAFTEKLTEKPDEGAVSPRFNISHQRTENKDHNRLVKFYVTKNTN